MFAADKIEEPWSGVEEILGEAWRSEFPEDTSNEEAICAPSALQNYHVLAPENIRAYEVKYRRASADDSPRNWQLEDILRSERRSVGGTLSARARRRGAAIAFRIGAVLLVRGVRS